MNKSVENCFGFTSIDFLYSTIVTAAIGSFEICADIYLLEVFENDSMKWLTSLCYQNVCSTSSVEKPTLTDISSVNIQTYSVDVNSQSLLLVVAACDGYVSKASTNTPIVVLLTSLAIGLVGLFFVVLFLAGERRLDIQVRETDEANFNVQAQRRFLSTMSHEVFLLQFASFIHDS